MVSSAKRGCSTHYVYYHIVLAVVQLTSTHCRNPVRGHRSQVTGQARILINSEAEEYLIGKNNTKQHVRI